MNAAFDSLNLQAVYTGSMFTKCGNFPDDPIPPRYLSSTNTSNIDRKLLSKRKMIKHVHVLPDGNCFFRSVAVYVHGDEDYHNIVQKALCSHITANQEICCFIIP